MTRRPSRRWCSACTCSTWTASWWSRTPAARWRPPPSRSSASGSAQSAGQDASWQTFGVVEDQEGALADDVAVVRAHPLIPDAVAVGGFLYDVDTGLLSQRV